MTGQGIQLIPENQLGWSMDTDKLTALKEGENGTHLYGDRISNIARQPKAADTAISGQRCVAPPERGPIAQLARDSSRR